MGKVEVYKDKLKSLEKWDDYLLNESGLPGPRANLELLEAVVELGTEDLFSRYVVNYNSMKAPTNSPEVFLAMCGVVGFGKLVSEGKYEFLKSIRTFANDIRWRIREGAAIALQRLGESDMELLLNEMKDWSKGNHLERRAVVAALCEPKLLTSFEIVRKISMILDQITSDLSEVSVRKEENFKVLRKALGYGWSVIAAAYPGEGKAQMEKWFQNEDKDIRWIMKENLRKNRLNRMDEEWTIKWKQALGIN